MNSVIWLLIIQGVLGAYDVLWNHEYKEKLPLKPSAALEQKIHGIREILYAILFIGLAWWAWHGVWAGLLSALIVIEILLTAWDFVIEDKTRLLGATERITHLVLSMVGGAYVALLIPILFEWSFLPTGFVEVVYGLRSWLLTAFGIGVLAWGIRDFWSGLVLSKQSCSKKANFLVRNHEEA